MSQRLTLRLVLSFIVVLGLALGIGPPTSSAEATPVQHALGAPSADGAAPTCAHDAANRLTTNGDATLAYDDDGNLLNDGTVSCAWDARGQLASIDGAAVDASFQYDVDGDRRARTVDSETRTWLHNGDNPVVEKTNGTVSGELTAAGVDGWLARRSGGVSDTVLTDALGSPVAFARADGSVTARMSYDPFGAQTTSGDLRGSDLGFTGRQVDGTGLLYYRARYYSPDLGRFISEDPIGLAGGANHYSYVGNSPAHATDPTGHIAQVVVACVGGAAFESLASWGTQRLSGQKVDWSGVGKAAAVGCSAGAVGFGAGKWLGSRVASANTAARACSFAGSTVVLMADGTKRPIEDIHTGDMIIATDPETGEQVAKRVEYVFAHDDTVLDLVVDGEVITTTEDHPFWSVTDQRFERADKLSTGEKVLGADGRIFTVSGLELGTDRDALAYNLTVEGIHTYHVGDDGILVHNTCPITGLNNGDALPTGQALDKAEQFLGGGYTQPGPGRYLSQDGLRQVRMRDADIAPRGGQLPHMNFETWASPVTSGGRNKLLDNLHIYLPEEYL